MIGKVFDDWLKNHISSIEARLEKFASHLLEIDDMLKVQKQDSEDGYRSLEKKVDNSIVKLRESSREVYSGVLKEYMATIDYYGETVKMIKNKQEEILKYLYIQKDEKLGDLITPLIFSNGISEGLSDLKEDLLNFGKIYSTLSASMRELSERVLEIEEKLASSTRSKKKIKLKKYREKN